MNIDFVQQALKNLKPDNPNWYSWASTDSEGNVIPSEDRMCWEHTISIIDGVVKPTKSEFDAEVSRLKTAYNNAAYQRNRAAEYPSIGDQLDMIYHNGDGGVTFQAAIKAVKDKYPKE